MLGADAASEKAAREALAAFPGGLQVGGGITPSTAPAWIDAGAAAVIVTSYVFRDGRLCEDRLGEMVAAVGRERLVLDLSCRKRRIGGAPAPSGAPPSTSAASDAAAWEYVVVADRWQTFTDTAVDARSLAHLSSACFELLVHGVDVEGMRLGVDAGLVGLLGEACPVPCTYAGGVAAMVRRKGEGAGARERESLSPGARVGLNLLSLSSLFTHRPTSTPSRRRPAAASTSPSAPPWTFSGATWGSRRWWGGAGGNRREACDMKRKGWKERASEQQERARAPERH